MKHIPLSLNILVNDPLKMPLYNQQSLSHHLPNLPSLQLILNFLHQIDHGPAYQVLKHCIHGYSVLALDMPGHGLSGGESLKSIEEMADWVSDVIDSVGYKEASLVGHSQGCLVTMECAS